MLARTDERAFFLNYIELHNGRPTQRAPYRNVRQLIRARDESPSVTFRSKQGTETRAIGALTNTNNHHYYHHHHNNNNNNNDFI